MVSLGSLPHGLSSSSRLAWAHSHDDLGGSSSGKEGKPQYASTFQISVSILLAVVPVAKASHTVKSRVSMGRLHTKMGEFLHLFVQIFCHLQNTCGHMKCSKFQGRLLDSGFQFNIQTLFTSAQLTVIGLHPLSFVIQKQHFEYHVSKYFESYMEGLTACTPYLSDYLNILLHWL